MAALSNHSIADSIISQKPTTTNTISSASRSESSHHRQHTISSAATPRSSVDHRPTDQLLHLGHASRRSHHAASASTSSLPRIASQRSSGGILSRAKDRTQSAFASISEPVLRPRPSNPGLARFTHGESLAPANRAPAAATTASPPSKNPSSDSLSSGEYTVAGRNPPSQAYVNTDASHPLPIRQTRGEPKMHQTSSRLLRMTDDDRPYTRDFKDLFSTLVVSLLPLSAHRVRLSKVEYTFLSEDAINNLGSLKFSQSNRMPDPKDASRIVTTTTTTTFSMAKDMARSICQRFVEARFIESADGKYQQVYSMKGGVWQLTSKGIAILDRFCSRNGIQQKQVTELSNTSNTQLVILERDLQTDKLINDWGTIEVIFRRFMGAEGRNVKSSVTAADSDSLHDYKDGLTGVKMAAERKINGRTFHNTFTGRAATDWLMDCSTIIDRRETAEVAGLFVEYGLVEALSQDRAYLSQNPGSAAFQPTKHAIYQVTQRGKDILSGSGSRGRASESEAGTGSQRNGITRDSNTQRLDKILNDPALRLLFRENLRDTHCEENLSFYKDVDEFVATCKIGIRAAKKSPNANSMDSIKEIMAQAYGIYNAFLAPGSPCELNIDHQLRNNLATRMTKAVGQDVAMIETLEEVTALFEDAQNAVFKLMASDSVPKFLRNAKYEQQLRNFDADLGRGPERSQSRSNRD
ncbi:developmental regulator flbA [Akanthomyces lecanii RCEF 1005]|uniref:Developmental regulator flbA n=1 Tax=Akanthomyces lecanii RCEF 1005 TaxID=1081108 RepID=A0A168GWN2_CORDF|nr:developmental regulator flbA [Akanthomyces lecanii RCEF 1005]